jgi:hypothetical protein
MWAFIRVLQQEERCGEDSLLAKEWVLLMAKEAGERKVYLAITLF